MAECREEVSTFQAVLGWTLIGAAILFAVGFAVWVTWRHR